MLPCGLLATHHWLHVTACGRERKPFPPPVLFPSFCLHFSPFPSANKASTPTWLGGWALGLPGRPSVFYRQEALWWGFLLPSREDTEAAPGWGQGATVPPCTALPRRL